MAKEPIIKGIARKLPTWEYLIVTQQYPMLGELNKLGKQGWEIINIQPAQSKVAPHEGAEATMGYFSFWQIIFKREII